VSGTSAVGSGRLGAVGGRLLGLAVFGAIWLSVVGGGAAWATTGHTFAGQFGGLGGGDGQFFDLNGIGGPVGLAVMPSTGEVFTLDSGLDAIGSPAPRVQRFNAAGEFQSAFPVEAPYNNVGPIAVGPAGSGAVYVSTNREPSPLAAVVKYSAAGEFAYELNATASGTTINNPLSGAAPLAVDPVDGTVYVTATVTDPNSPSVGAQVIDRFNGATGAFLDYFDGSNGSPDGGFTCPVSLAVDGSQRVYVLDNCPGGGKNRVDRYGADGAYQVTVDDGSRGAVAAVAAEPVSDEVYVAENDALVGWQITHFSAGGAGVVHTFAASNVGGVRAVAVSGVGTVYTSDTTKAFVERFARFDGPTVVTGSVSSVEARSVMLEGTIDPEGVASSYHFEYGTDLTYGSRTDDMAAGSGNGAVAASAAVTGLSPSTPYYFRIVGSNDAGSIVGASGTLTTGAAPPVLGSSAFASTITPRSARLHGKVNASNGFTLWHFEYGTTTAYGTSGTFGASFGSLEQTAISDIAGLEPGTTYHFRLVADNGVDGPQSGSDETFVTAPAAGGGATGVTAGRAMLTGTINPHGVATTYHFNYGVTASYGSSTPEADGGSGDANRPVSAEILGLLPDTTYHVQVVATSADGVIRTGGDGLFRTASAPTADVVGPTGVSTAAATVTGDVNTFGLAGSYHFDVWSLDSSYAISTTARAAAGYASVERVSAALAGLPAGETFVVQLSVTSNDATGVSDVDTFATAEVPRVFPSPPASDGPSVYGCGSPRLNAYNTRPKPGDTITISGQDLGVGGSVMLSDQSLKPAEWSPTGFKVSLPEEATGTLALTVNCGRRSNTIAVTLFQEPVNGFSVLSRSVAGSAATLRVRVPGPGKLESFGAGTLAAKVRIKEPGTATIKVTLTSGGVRALSRAARHTRKVPVRVRFTPAGGRSASKTVTITFKQKGGR
jgi:hypothetical protein